MPTYRLDLAWDGTEYSGWQVQPNARSIQGEIEKVLAMLYPGESPVVLAAGRTDAGVHALHQIASFSVQGNRSTMQIHRFLNARLPNDIVCAAVSEVPDNFAPRGMSKEKMYRYRILHRKHSCPFRHRYTHQVLQDLNIPAMQEAARYFVGAHDFQAFQAQGCSADTTIRKISFAEIKIEGDEIHFEVIGKGFLRHQVRIMMGTLLKVGENKISPMEIKEIIARKDRKLAGMTAPSKGLFLVWTSLLDNDIKTE